MADDGLDLDALTTRWREALDNLDRTRAKVVARDAIEALGVTRFGDDVVTATLEDIGTDWERGELSLAEVYAAGRISAQIIDDVVETDPVEGTARLAVTLLDDHHALGKNLVIASLRVARIPVSDLGTTTVDELVETVQREGIGMLFVSTLMLRSALRVKHLIQRLDEVGADVRVIVGGAPFRLDPELVERVGAHGVGNDAAEAVAIARAWLESEATA